MSLNSNCIEKKILNKIFCLCLLFVLASCETTQVEYWEEPEYDSLAANVSIVEAREQYVVYEYKNVRLDEVAPIASLYCNDHGNKQAVLYKVITHNNNSRRVTFSCEEIGQFR